MIPGSRGTGQFNPPPGGVPLDCGEFSRQRLLTARLVCHLEFTPVARSSSIATPCSFFTCRTIIELRAVWFKVARIEVAHFVAASFLTCRCGTGKLGNLPPRRLLPAFEPCPACHVPTPMNSP